MTTFFDRRYYTRYEVQLSGKAADERGVAASVEVPDISIEGARVRTDDPLPISVGSIIYLLIKWKVNIKLKGEVRWLKKDGPFLEFGIKFLDIDMDTRQTLSGLISEQALSNLSAPYLK